MEWKDKMYLVLFQAPQKTKLLSFFSFVVYSFRLRVETCVCLCVFNSKLPGSHIWFTAGLYTHAYLSLFYCAKCWFFSSYHSGIMRQEVCRKWRDILKYCILCLRWGVHIWFLLPPLLKKEPKLLLWVEWKLAVFLTHCLEAMWLGFYARIGSSLETNQCLFKLKVMFVH